MRVATCFLFILFFFITKTEKEAHTNVQKSLRQLDKLQRV